MTKGICLSGFTALRGKPASSAEMVSSLVFGEQYTVLQEQGDWLEVSNDFDGYRAWLSSSNHNPLTKNISWKRVTGREPWVDEEGNHLHLAPGCCIPEEAETEFVVEGGKYKRLAHYPVEGDAPASTARLFLGTPYLWGGRSIYGIDCSGLVQMVYAVHRRALPRDSGPQSRINDRQLRFSDLKEGDLAFFVNAKAKVNHVGMVLQGERILHASGSVHIDTLTADGIVNREGKKTHDFAWGIRP